MAFCWDIPSHEKNPDPGRKNSLGYPDDKKSGKNLESPGFFENFGDKNLEIKKNPKFRGHFGICLGFSSPDSDLNHRDFGISRFFDLVQNNPEKISSLWLKVLFTFVFEDACSVPKGPIIARHEGCPIFALHPIWLGRGAKRARQTKKSQGKKKFHFR